jgi:hypothetical protein
MAMRLTQDKFSRTEFTVKMRADMAADSWTNIHPALTAEVRHDYSVRGGDDVNVIAIYEDKGGEDSFIGWLRIED